MAKYNGYVPARIDIYRAFVSRYMHEFMALVVLAGVLPVSMNVMVSIKKPLSGVLISLSKQLVLILLLLFLPRILGIDGVLLAGPCATFWSPSQPLSWSDPLSGSWMRMQSLFYETAAQTEHA